MESTDSKTWDVNSDGSKWLAENLKGMDQSVKRMLKLIEDGSSSTNDELNGQGKPELIANVEEFHQLYQILAERYDVLTKYSGKSASQSSGDSESGYDQDSLHETPDVKASGVDTSPSSRGAESVFSLKANGESSSGSSSDSDTESFVTSYLRTPLSINTQTMHQKISEIEAELSAVKDELQTREADIKLEKERVTELEARVSDKDYKAAMLVEELEVAKDLLTGSDEEISKLKQELRDKTSEGNELQKQLVLAREEIAMFNVQLASEKEHAFGLEEMIARYDADLSDRDLEVWELKVAVRDAEEQFYQEKGNAVILSEKQECLDLKIKELEETMRISEAEKQEIQSFLDSQVTALQDEHSQLRADLANGKELINVLNRNFDSCKLKYDELIAEKDEMSAEIEMLTANLSARDDRIRELESHLVQIRNEHEKLIDESRDAHELIGELKTEVEKQRVVISEGAEEKREAIRQLCFSLEHYRSGYQELRQVFVVTRRNAVLAA